MAKTTSPKATKTKTAASPKTTKPKVPTPPEAPEARVVEPTIVAAAEPIVSSGVLRKPDLISAVVMRSGAKPRDVKPIVDAVLATLGEAIADGQELNLPPLGKLKLQRAKETDKARITIAKLRQPKV